MRAYVYVLMFALLAGCVNDPQYLTQEFLTSTHFKKEPYGAKWSPSVCTSR